MTVLRKIVTCMAVPCFFILTSNFVAGDDSLRDIQVGMQGLMEASKDPAVLAQLMKDMQDPELMAEAQRMMNNPEFAKQMKDMQKSKEYQETIKKTKDYMSDPTKAAHAEAKLEHMARVGDDQIKKNAANAMEQAMASLNDPKVMDGLLNMMKDPEFKTQMASMAKDSQFKAYVDVLKDMVKDPEKKKLIEDATRNVKANM